MKREIKFRAWDMALGRMRGVDSVRWGFDGKIIKVEFTDGSYKSWHYDLIDDVVLMQFTGLRDKNGKEIYEGDVVSVNHPFKQRKYQGDIEYYGNKFGSQDFYFSHQDDPADIFESIAYLEVVGNIYENPELLTNKQ